MLPQARTALLVRTVAGVVGLSLLLAGCTGGGDPPGPTPATAVPQRDVNAHDRSELQQGGTLRQPVEAISGSWNPLSPDGDSAGLDTIREPLLPHLFSYDAAGVPTPDPDYLVSATQTAASPTTVVYVLNPKAVWGDGSPVDGDDLAATWRACNGTDPGFRCARADAFAQIASVTSGTDKFSVTVTFKGVYPDWVEVFDRPGVLKAESVVDAATFADGWSSIDNDWLAGPFRFDQYDPAAKILTEVRNERWWGDPPLLDQLLFRAVAPADQAAAYAGHQLDTYRIDPATSAQVAALPGTTVRQAPGAQVRELSLGAGAGVLAEPTVRQSVARAIDRSALAAAALQGTGRPVDPVGSHVFLPGQQGYVDNAPAGGVTTDPTRAQADLDAAGWVRGADGFRAKGGAVLQLGVLVADGDPSAVSEARLLVDQLDAVGIRAEVESVAPAAWTTRLRAHDFEVALGGRTVTRSPFDALAPYVSRSATNTTQLSSPEVDALVTQVRTGSDPGQRATAANQADVLLWSAATVLPLYQRPDLVASTASVANFGAFGLSTISYEDVGYLR